MPGWVLVGSMFASSDVPGGFAALLAFVLASHFDRLEDGGSWIGLLMCDVPLAQTCRSGSEQQLAMQHPCLRTWSALSDLPIGAHGKPTERFQPACRLPGWSLQAACCRALKACPRPPLTASRSSRQQPSRPSSERPWACSVRARSAWPDPPSCDVTQKASFRQIFAASCHALHFTVTCPAASTCGT